MKIVSIMTATGEKNLGDELILLQEIIALRNLYPQDILRIYTHDIKNTQ